MNKNLKGIIALVVTVVLAFCVIWGTNVLTKDLTIRAVKMKINLFRKKSPDGYENVKSALKLLYGDGKAAGYQVTVLAEGYGGDVTLLVSFDAEAAHGHGCKGSGTIRDRRAGVKNSRRRFFKAIFRSCGASPFERYGGQHPAMTLRGCFIEGRNI